MLFGLCYLCVVRQGPPLHPPSSDRGKKVNGILLIMNKFDKTPFLLTHSFSLYGFY